MVGKGRRHCEICGVREAYRSGFFARFPIDEDRCKMWIRQVGKEDLVNVPIEKLHETRTVCGDHFDKTDFGKSGKRLKKKAFPKLELSAPPLTDYQLREFPQHIASKAAAVPIRVVPEQLGPLEPIPSTSKEQPSFPRIQNLNAAPDQSRPENAAAPDQSRPENAAAPDQSRPENAAAPDQFRPKKRLLETTGIVAKRIKMTQAEEVRMPLSSINSGTERVESSAALVTDPESHTPANQNIDCDMKKEKVLKELKELKATIKSLKKNAKLLEKLQSPFLKEIVSLALKNQKRKPKGRRWTTQYKISCLAIMKRSPKAYRYLRHLVPLPSIRTLQNILQKVPMEPGICRQVLDTLRNSSKVSDAKDKYCCLLFDEIAIKPRLYFNLHSDSVDGFTDVGKRERSSALVDHALVLMIQGIRSKFKQPLGFYFVKGTTSSQKLAAIIKEAITAIHETGFHVVATICDQGPTNMGALKILTDSAPSESGPTIKNHFTVENKRVYTIYDVPHLFKSIRNNFYNYGTMKLGNKTAKWAHLKEAEIKNRALLYLSKITPSHVEPKYRGKMKVKYAAQILSNTVAVVVKLLALAESGNKKEQMFETGEVIESLDKLFDYTNGPSGPEDIKRGRRQNVSIKTDHVSVWAHYRKLMETISFTNELGIAAKNARCIQGYKITLCSLRDIWGEVQRLGFKYLNLRQLNQDALENLFGVLRQHSPTNRNPTVTSFIAALKTTIISGMSAPHNRGFNCQKDNNRLLSDLHNLVFELGSKTETSEVKVNEEHLVEHDQNKENEIPFVLHILDEDDDDELGSNLLSVEGQPIVYISGYLSMCTLKKHKCNACKDALTTSNPDNDPTFIYIQLREWWKDKRSLTYPSINLCKYVEKCVSIFETDIIPILHQCNISNHTVTMFMANSDGSFIKCNAHRSSIFHSVSLRLAILLIRRQCQRVNLKLSEQEEALADKNKKAQQLGMAR